MKRQPLNTTHQVLIGIAIATLFIMAAESFRSEASGWNVTYSSDDGGYKISVRDGRDRLKVHSRGKIEYRPVHLCPASDGFLDSQGEPDRSLNIPAVKYRLN